MYSVLKFSHQFEYLYYLSQISYTRKRTALSNFWLGNNILRIHPGIYTDEARGPRKCRFCNGKHLKLRMKFSFFGMYIPRIPIIQELIFFKNKYSEIHVDYAHPIGPLMIKSMLQKETTSGLFADYVSQMFKIINSCLKQTNKKKKKSKFKIVLIS